MFGGKAMSKAVCFDPLVVAKRFSCAFLERRPRKYPKRRYYLIISEGKETETSYFDSLKRKLPHEMIRRIYIKGTGANTLSLLRIAENEIEKRYKSKNPPFYKIWLVFDHDSFPHSDFDNTINSARSKNVPNKCHWDCAWSHEAFELWYLLHFNNHSAGLSRTQFRKKLEVELRTLGVNRKYRKNAKDMYDLLEPLQEQAIHNAKQMLNVQNNKGIPPSQMNPATTVHLLVEELISYIS
jgi:RloB-like protein